MEDRIFTATVDDMIHCLLKFEAEDEVKIDLYDKERGKHIIGTVKLLINMPAGSCWINGDVVDEQELN